MPEEISPPVKRSDGTLAPRGLKTGPPIDPTSVTLSNFEPVTPANPAAETNPGATDPTASPPLPAETQTKGTDATFVAPPAGDKTLGPKSDATIKELGPGKERGPSNIDATLVATP